MILETQTIINGLAGIIGLLFGILLQALWTAVRDLQAADKELAATVKQIEILVVGDYLKREEFNQAMDAVFRKLDKIEELAHRKADK